MSLENATPMEKFRNSCGFQFNFVFHSGLSVEEAIDHLCERAEDYRRAMAEEEAAKTLVLSGDGLITAFQTADPQNPLTRLSFWRSMEDFKAQTPPVLEINFGSAEALRDYWILNLNALAQIWFEVFKEPIIPQEGAEG